MKTRMFGILTTATLLLAAACGDDTTASGGASSVGGSDLGGGGAVSTGGTNQGGQAQGGQGQGGSAPVVDMLASFDAASFDLPEGLAVDGDSLVLGFAFSSKVDRFDLAGAGRTNLASLPVPAQNTGFMTGVTTDAAGDVYAALVSFSGSPTPGVYRIPAGGGAPELFASHPQLVFPNGFAWSDDGSLFVTDSASGAVFHVATDGATTLWKSDALLAGNPPACGGQPDDIAVGANGLVWTPDELLVASSDQGVVVRIPILADGSAGDVSPFAGPDCALLAGIDGIVADSDGSLVGAVNRADRLVRISPTGDATTWLEGAPFDFPASLAFHGTGPSRALYVTSFALGRALAGQPANPALVRVTVGE